MGGRERCCELICKREAWRASHPAVCRSDGAPVGLYAGEVGEYAGLHKRQENDARK